MPALDFLGPSARDAEDRPQGTSRLVNVYRVPGERSPAVCRTVPGMTRRATLPGAMMRAMIQVRGRLVAAHGGALWRVEGGVATKLRDVGDSPETDLATLDGATLAKVGAAYRIARANGTSGDPDMTATAFSAVGSVVVMAQRAVLTERNGARVQWSNVSDPEAFHPLSFAEAEQRSEPIIRAVVVGPELWLMKGTHFERWTPLDAGFAYLPGSLTEIGLAGYRLVTSTPRGAFFVGSDGRAYLASDAGMEALSTGPVESAIALGQARDVLHTRYEARDVCAVTFADRPAWACDLATGEWHERAQGDDLGPWRVAAAAEAGGTRYVGTDDGGVFALTTEVRDDGEPLHRLMMSRTLQVDGKRFRVPALELQAHVGRGDVGSQVSYVAALAVDVNADGVADGALEVAPGAVLKVAEATRRLPQVTLRVSGDHGMTWGDGKPRSLGGRGEYSTRLVWRSLGLYRAFTAELRCAEPLDVAFDGTAFVDLA